jgi:hypothetical protein
MVSSEYNHQEILCIIHPLLWGLRTSNILVLAHKNQGVTTMVVHTKAVPSSTKGTERKGGPHRIVRFGSVYASQECIDDIYTRQLSNHFIT